MTLIEVLILLGGVAGVLAGFGVGFHSSGLLGGLCGAVLGVAGGVFGAGFLIFGVGFAGFVLERASKRLGLKPHFGRYWQRRHAVAWSAAKELLSQGAPVRGRVVLRKYYGSFIDIGCGFPALLKTVDGANFPAGPFEKGTELEADVLEFEDSDPTVVVTKSSRKYFIFEDVRVGHLLGEEPLQDGPAAYIALTNSTHARFLSRLDEGEPLLCQVWADGQLHDVTLFREPQHSGRLFLRVVSPR
jgi:hypothetical protein